MNEIDKDEDDYIILEEFKASVDWDESTEDVGVANIFTAPPPPQPTGKDRIGNSFTVPIPEAVLAHIKIKVKKVQRFKCVCTS